MNPIFTALQQAIKSSNSKEFSSFITMFCEYLVEENVDLRTLGHQKRLHVFSRLAGFDNWHSMKAKLAENEFIEASQRIFGVSEAHADATWLSLKSTILKENTPNAEEAAIAFYTSKGISPLDITKNDNGSRDNNALQIALRLMEKQDFTTFNPEKSEKSSASANLSNAFSKSTGKDSHGELVESFIRAIEKEHADAIISDIVTVLDDLVFDFCGTTKEVSDQINNQGLVAQINALKKENALKDAWNVLEDYGYSLLKFNTYTESHQKISALTSTLLNRGFITESVLDVGEYYIRITGGASQYAENEISQCIKSEEDETNSLSNLINENGFNVDIDPNGYIIATPIN